MSTSVTCRRFRISADSMIQSHSKCPGKLVPWGIQKRGWTRIQAVPDVANKLPNASKITEEEADWFVGTARCRGRRNILCVSLNANGAAGVWKALEMTQGYDVIFMQETALKPNDLRETSSLNAELQPWLRSTCHRNFSIPVRPSRLPLPNDFSPKQTWMRVDACSPPRPDQTLKDCAMEHVDLFQEGGVNDLSHRTPTVQIYRYFQSSVDKSLFAELTVVFQRSYVSLFFLHCFMFIRFFFGRHGAETCYCA